MSRSVQSGWRWVVVGVCLALAALGLSAQEATEVAGKAKPERRPSSNIAYLGQLLSVGKIEERLGQTLGDEKRQKIDAIREKLKLKLDEVLSTDAYRSAYESKKDAQSPEERAAADLKVKEALGGFDVAEEYKKELASVLSEEEVLKAFQRPSRKKKEDPAQSAGTPKPEEDDG